MENIFRDRTFVLSEFRRISQNLDSKMPVVAIGGTPMVLREQKDETKDVDLIVFQAADKSRLIHTLRRLGYSRKFGARFQHPLTKFFVDVGVRKFLEIPLTKRMVKRAERMPLGNLTLLILSDEDNLIFKCMGTARKYVVDVKDIISSRKINWDTLYDEVKAVTAESFDKGGKTNFALNVANMLGKIKEEYGIVDDEVAEKFRKLAATFKKKD